MSRKKEDGKSLEFQKFFLFSAPSVLNRCALETLVVFERYSRGLSIFALIEYREIHFSQQMTWLVNMFTVSRAPDYKVRTHQN